MASSSPPAPPVVILSDTESDGDGDAAELSRPAAECIASSLCTQAEVDALCKKHGIPREFRARLAGNRRACTPPPGTVCVYAHALEAGLRFPLHAFISEALSYFRLPPGQLTPNGWRVLVGFVVLCHSAGVPPSLAVFRDFFTHRRRGWCFFRCRKGAVALFAGLKSHESGKKWNRGFFFLTSPEPWPCPVRWNEEPPSKISTARPVLSSQDKTSVAKLVHAHGAGVDLRTYLSESNLAAAFSSHLAGTSRPPPLQPCPRSTGSEGMDLSADEVAAPAEKVEAEPVRDTPQLSGVKRKREEDANAKGGLRRSEPNTPPAATPSLHNPPLSGMRAPLVSDHTVPDAHDGDSAGWEEARKMLERIVPPERAREFAAAKPSDVVEEGFVAMHQAVNHVSFSLDRALELEKKQKAQERDIAALREQLRYAKSELSSAKRVMEAERENAKAELAAGRRATEAEVESAKAAAVQQFLGSKEYTRRVAEQAAAAYEHGAEVMKCVALRVNPRLDATKLVLLLP